MADIGEELLRAVRADFCRELGDSDSRLAKLLKRIQGGKGTMHDAALFSKECGAALSAALAKNVTPDRLPNGTLYYNIAEKILGGTLRDNYDLLNMAAQAVQEQTDSKLNIRIEPQKAEFPQERVHKIINAAADQTADSETIKRRLDAPVQNVTESFFDDYVEENAKFRDEAGLQTYLVRQTNGKCCDWCASLVGRFRYEDAPEDIFHKHDNCTCTVDYITGTYRQDVWSKRKYALTPEQRKEILNSTPKPTRFTKEQAQNLQNNILNGVANSGDSGIISLSDSNSIYREITQNSISNVPKMNIFNDETLDNAHREASRDLLREVARHKELKAGTEFSIVYDEHMNLIPNCGYIQGGMGNVRIDNPNVPYHAFHNHGSGETFSIQDLRGFARRSNMISLTAQGNTGSKYVISSTKQSDRNGFYNFLTNMSNEVIFKTENQDITLSWLYDKSNKSQLHELFSNLNKEQKRQLKNAIVDKTNECLKGAENYGIKYTKTVVANK